MQSAEVKGVGDAVYGRLGFNEWADSNRIIVLYPQIDTHYALNPAGCWDWTGYTGPAFASAPACSFPRSMPCSNG